MRLACGGGGARHAPSESRVDVVALAGSVLSSWLSVGLRSYCIDVWYYCVAALLIEVEIVIRLNDGMESQMES